MKICLGCMEKYDDNANKCPYCGYEENMTPENAMHMEPGSILRERYIVGKVIGYGGFGVTYIGWDGLLQTKVAIKEYLPSEFSTRAPGHTQVTVFSGDKEEQFRDGMKRFVEEAKKLAKYHSLPGIVKVFDSFEENGTAYIVMELLEGETLSQLLKREGRIPRDKAVEMLMPVIESLEKVHKDGIIHRDIAPDNIFVTKKGKVKLIDFGAARYATTTHSRSLTVIIKPGYSPEEQYRSRGDQGAYTDVYALAATMYRMITGHTPPDALERRAFFENKHKDTIVLPGKYVKDLDENTENALLNALNVRIEDRTQNMEIFRSELLSEEKVKRRAGRIQRLDLYRWPLWAKITAPVASCAIITLLALLFAGVIKFGGNLKTDITDVEGQTRVPSVINKSLPDAEGVMAEYRLLIVATGKEFSGEVEEDLVLSQSIDPGVIVPDNTRVSVIISSAKILQQVPNVVGMDHEEAKESLEYLGFSVSETEEYSAVVAKGCVIAQDKEPFNDIDDGSEIKLTVSLGKDPSQSGSDGDITVVKLVGTSLDDALTLAGEQGFALKVTGRSYSKEFARNSIMTQSVSEGTSALRDTVIEVTVSNGFEKVSVPDVCLHEEEKARRLLEGRGLKCVVLYEESDSVAQGSVISQEPDADSEADPLSEATIHVSTGPAAFAMPNVVGRSKEEAAKLLGDNQLSVLYNVEKNLDIDENTVLAQSVKAGDEVRAGDSVTLTICTHGNVVKVPDVKGKTRSDAESALESAGLKVEVKTQSSATVAKNKVISQSPSADTQWEKGGTVTIVVSTGKDTSSSSRSSSAASSSRRSATSSRRSTTSTYTTQPNDEVTVYRESSSEETSHRSESSKAASSKAASSKAASSKAVSSQPEVKEPDYSSDYEYELNTANTITITKYKGSAAQVNIPSAIDGKAVSMIGDSAFENCTSLREVTIPDSVTSIGEWAFCRCTSLQQVTIPDSVTSIGYAVFGRCTSLQQVTIPDSVTTIGGSAFEYCTSLQQVTIPDSVTTIGGSAFENCTSLQQVTIPDSVTEIGDRVFNSCSSLQQVTIPDSVTEIGDCVFNSCSSLQQVTIPDSVTEIGIGAFYECTSLQQVTIPSSVTSIGDYVFYDCTSLQQVTIPDSVTSIGSEAFCKCTSLQQVTIPDSVTSIGDWAFVYCESLQQVTIPDSVTHIGQATFNGCPNVTIYGESGSYAETYAAENNIPFAEQ